MSASDELTAPVAVVVPVVPAARDSALRARAYELARFLSVGGVAFVVDLGLFNPAQTRLLAEQKLDVAEGLLIVEAQQDDLMVVVRLAPPHPAMRARYEKALAGLKCGNLPT